MTTLIDQFEMKTHLPGLLTLLAQHLYPSPDIFLRELIQNAHDALLLRQSREPALEGRIDILADGATLVLRDNGVGMDEADIRQFLSVIGASSKPGLRDEVGLLQELTAGGLIGQFGIGFLSAFVVASSIEVTTRKLGSDQGYLWRNDASLDCRLEAADGLPVGTEVRLAMRGEFSWMLDREFLAGKARRFAEFLPFPIHVAGQGPVNRRFGPWQQADLLPGAEFTARCRDYLADRFVVQPLDVIPFDLHEPCRAQGALFITPEELPWANARGHLTVYVRHMHVNDREESLLPAWAGFVRGVIDSPDLVPTAARDHLQDGHESTTRLRDALGELVLQRLLHLAENEPGRFHAIQAVHGAFLKVMASEDARLFDAAAGLLRMRTNAGNLSLTECLEYRVPGESVPARKILYFFTRRGDAPTFFAMADAQGRLVVDASWSVDCLLLERMARQRRDELDLRHMDDCDDQSFYAPLDTEEQARYQPLCRMLQQAVMRHIRAGVRLEARRFDPMEQPALLVSARSSRLGREIGEAAASAHASEISKLFLAEAMQRQVGGSDYLFLNVDNPLVANLQAKLPWARPGSDDLVVGAARLLFGMALLAKHDALDLAERRYLQDCFAEAGQAQLRSLMSSGPGAFLSGDGLLNR